MALDPANSRGGILELVRLVSATVRSVTRRDLDDFFVSQSCPARKYQLIRTIRLGHALDSYDRYQTPPQVNIFSAYCV